ncbi:MAG: hypothetical protein NWE95_07010 [Candidatus Bathyarchaeota archaeon]|nr:hypothetical protein [Candidatus Bathyarchaeota archaeon]
MTIRISTQDADIIHRGEARFPTQGSQCNASCAFYAFCANSVDFEKCRGFILMNGENLALIKRNLDENTIQYIQNSYPVIQRSLRSGDREFAEVVTRDIKRLGEMIPQTSNSEQKIINVSLFGDYQLPLNANITKPTPNPQQPQPETTTTLHLRNCDIQRSIQEDRLKQTYPEFCTPECPHMQCPYRRAQNYGKTCLQKIQWELKNP